MHDMDINEIIDSKIRRIEHETGNGVIIEEKARILLDHSICVDFANWYTTTSLPKILHQPNIEDVHILHELIHLEMFFIDGYYVLSSNTTANPEYNRTVRRIAEQFSNIPENYVAHKLIAEYGFNPICEAWFGLEIPTEGLELAAWLVDARLFSEFRPAYKKMVADSWADVQGKSPYTYSVAANVMTLLESMDYTDKDAYNAMLGPIINMFAPEYYTIIDSFRLNKVNGVWLMRSRSNICKGGES